jgi:hypothetical protein
MLSGNTRHQQCPEFEISSVVVAMTRGNLLLPLHHLRNPSLTSDMAD